MVLPTQDVVIVSGTATIELRPDVASFDVGIETEGRDVRALAAENAKVVARILAVLKERGVAPEELRTSAFTVSSIEKDERKAGYRVATTVTVTRNTANDLGELLAAAIEAGANEVHGPEFSVRDEKAVQDQCLARAFADARSKAAKLATLSARGLGKVLAATDGSSSPFEFRYRTPGVEGGVVGGMLVETGVHPVPCGVTVAFRLE